MTSQSVLVYLMTSPSPSSVFLMTHRGFDDVISPSCAFGDVTVPSLGLDDVIVPSCPYGDVTVSSHGSDFVTVFSRGFGDVNMDLMTSSLKSKKTSSSRFSRYYVRSEWISLICDVFHAKRMLTVLVDETLVRNQLYAMIFNCASTFP
jgi:hypothetical protein